MPNFAKRREKGQSLVELAISLTVILLLLSGAVDFGMALFSYVMIRDAAQEGAQFGAINPYFDTNGNGQYDSGEPVNADGIRQHVRASSSSPIIKNLLDTNIDIQLIPTNSGTQPCEGTTVAIPNAIQVTVKYNYPIIMPYIGAIIGSQTIPLSAQVTDTILTPACP